MLTKLKFILLLGLLQPLSAYAGTCSMTTITPLMFGKYNNKTINGNGTVFVSCTDDNPYTFCVTSPNATGESPPNEFTIMLYADPSRTAKLTTSECLALSGGTDTTKPVTAACPYTSPCQLSIYGQIAAGQINKTTIGAHRALYSLVLNMGGSTVQTVDSAQAQFYVTSGCNISADQVTFGVYNPNTTATLAQNSIHVTCSPGTTYSIGLSAGRSGNFNQRTLTSLSSNGSVLKYNLYLPTPAKPTGVCSSYSTIWSDTCNNKVSGTGTGAQQNFALCGKIPAGQTTAPAGIYSDTITATVTY